MDSILEVKCTNECILGGENVLLKASASLVELKKILTGPKLDYIDCIDCTPQYFAVVTGSNPVEALFFLSLDP